MALFRFATRAGPGADNGAMIASAGIEKLRLARTDGLAAPTRARWPLDRKAERLRNDKA